MSGDRRGMPWRSALLFLMGLAAPFPGFAEENNPWIQETARARPILDAYGNPSFEMKSVRYGRMYLRLPESREPTVAMFEEIATVTPPEEEADGHTRLSVWTYDEKHPRRRKKLFVIEDQCVDGRFLPDKYAPQLYEMSCGADYAERKYFRISDGKFVGRADYKPAHLEIWPEPSTTLWVMVRIMEHKSRQTGHPPYPVAELTLMRRDEVLDRVVVANDDLAYAEDMASKPDSFHSVAFADIKGFNIVTERVGGEGINDVRIVYTIGSLHEHQVVIPFSIDEIKINDASIPNGFSMVRVHRMVK